MALDDEGQFGYRPLLEAIYAALGELADDGYVSEQELRRMAIPTVGRSRADLLAPFSDTGRFVGLAVEQVDVFLAEDQIWAEFNRDRDAAAFGACWAAFSRASVFPTLALGLDGKPDSPRAASFVARLEAATAARLAGSPQQMAIPLGMTALAKTLAEPQ